MKDPFLYRADDSLGGQPGRADGVRRVEGANSLANARLEGKGATLITGHSHCIDSMLWQTEN